MEDAGAGGDCRSLIALHAQTAAVLLASSWLRCRVDWRVFRASRTSQELGPLTLLSNSYRADAIPGLQIEADDVRCTHGSTTGRVDDELVFYAMCRGFTRKEAIRMIVTGFFQQVFDRFTIESVREALGHAVARRVRDYE